ncbi:MAG TPA: nucleotide exchange factor GrpE [Burkholderiaceae bacterium]|nr:nucleotide exchange factor GrpE [Burkholderiaceae bacterium]
MTAERDEATHPNGTAKAANDPAQMPGETAVQNQTAERPALGSAAVADVERDLQAALAKANENYESFLRAKAEVENTRRRAQEDISKAHKFAIESFAESLVPVIDSLEKALEVQNATAESLREGVEITLRQLKGAFERNKLAPIDPRGEKFDPHKHQAISMVPAENVPSNHVVSVLQKGWMIAERVLRPALVTVAQASAAETKPVPAGEPANK